ncbi:MAG: hypothetical protein ACRDH2_04895, partial [Anaerolineales bacterium]
HSEALQRTLASIRPSLAPGAGLIGLIPEAEPGLVAAALAAADQAGYALRGAALRADTAEAQFVWDGPITGALRSGSQPSEEAEKPDFSERVIQETARHSALEALHARAEPSRWSTLHFAAWCGLAEKRLLAPIAGEPLSTVNRLLESVFRDPDHFQRFGASRYDDPTTGLWFVGQVAIGNPSLADRVEAEVLRLLSSDEVVDEYEIMRAVCAALPGVQTPGRGLVLACLNSYARRVEPDAWRLRPEDAPAVRAQELQSILAALRGLGERHGYRVAGENPQEWGEAGQTLYLFAVIPSANFSTSLLTLTTPAARRFLVLPGSRSGLAEFKLRRDPRLRAAMQAGGWRFVKFRQIRRMAADSQLARADLEPAFEADPLEEMKQLSLIADR